MPPGLSPGAMADLSDLRKLFREQAACVWTAPGQGEDRGPSPARARPRGFACKLPARGTPLQAPGPQSAAVFGDGAWQEVSQVE